jgi:hypothetical protein
MWTPTIVVVAERPEAIVGDIRAGTSSPNFNPPVIVTVGPDELPSRIEAWSAIDRLVWQDMDSTALTEAQVEALRGWVTAGGQLAIVGGTTGTSTLDAFPGDLLPYRPTVTVDVPTEDLEDLLATLPADAEPIPAVGGLLDEGTVLARSGDHVFAARRTVGQGAVTIVGIDPATDWLAGSETVEALWRRLVPTSTNGGVVNPLVLQDDSTLVAALGNLPAVDLPDIAVLLGLLLLYIALIGPVNYLVLRRLDRRELAWITMPVLVGVFAVAAYALGSGLKGTDIIINQVGIVRTAAGAERGIGQFYVGVFSPTRATYQVGVDQSALLTTPLYLGQQGRTTTPLDVITGDASRLRNYEVGYAVLRSFRAEADVAVPRLDADLAYREGTLSGTVTNGSTQPLEAVVVVWGRAVQVLPDLAPGASADVSLDVAAARGAGRQLSERIFGPYPMNGETTRTEATRRTVIDQLSNYDDKLAGSVQEGPIVLAWAGRPGIGVDLGTPAKQVGDTLHLYPAPVSVVGPTIYQPTLLGRSIVASQANEAMDQGMQLSLSRGTMTTEFRPMGFGGPFQATGLSLMITNGDVRPLTGRGREVQPLPADQQPPQDDPLGGAVQPVDIGGADGGDDVPVIGVIRGAAGGGGQGAAFLGGRVAVEPVADQQEFFDGMPDIQLLDRVAGRWVEFPHPVNAVEYRLARPERYIDATGALLIRFVNRAPQDMVIWFTPLIRLEGIAG